MRWVISNTVALNGGDAAILRGVAACIRMADPQAHIVVYDNQPEPASRHHPDFDFRRLAYLESRRTPWPGLSRKRALLAARWWARGRAGAAALVCPKQLRAAVRDYVRADFVVSTGGTYLIDAYPVHSRLFDFELARSAGTPLIFFTQSLGPFRVDDRGEKLRPHFDASALVLLRDERSRSHLLRIGVRPERLFVVADVVFTLADPEQVEQGLNRRWPERPRVAVSVRDWKHFAQRDPVQGMALFEASIAAMVKHLVQAHRAQVTFLSTCQGIAEYPKDDSKVARRIVESLPAHVQAEVQVEDAFCDPSEIVRRYRACDLVVATRMHAAILALSAGTPVLPIAYEFKTQELFASLGAEDRVVDIESVTPEASVQELDRFIEGYADHCRTVFPNVLHARRSARTAVDHLRALIADLDKVQERQ